MADPELRNSGAQNLPLWEAIRFASTVTRIFDFEGSKNENIERCFRSFGARQTPLFHVRKIGRRLRAMIAVKDLIEVCTGDRLKWFLRQAVDCE